MTEKLIENPSILLWKEEFEMILNGSQNIDINKLGTIGSYIENTFKNTEKIKYSKECFQEVLKEYICAEIQNDSISKANIELIFSSLNRFKSDKDLLTSESQYFKWAIQLIEKIIELTNTIFENENVIFDFCLYINTVIINNNDEITLFEESLFRKKLLECLKSIVGISDRISSLSLHLINKLQYPLPEEVFNLNMEIKKNILRYSIKDNEIANIFINNFIIDYAINHKVSFLEELNRFEYTLNSACNTLLDDEGLIVKDLAPQCLDWEKLIKLFGSKIKSHVLLNKGLKKEICLY